jgi:hypothetical protein
MINSEGPPENSGGPFAFVGSRWLPTSTSAQARPLVEFVLRDFAAQRIAMNAEHVRGLRLIAVCPVQNPFDKALLEFSDSFVEQDATLYHLAD